MARDSAYGAHVRINGIRQHYLHYPGPGRSVLIVPGIASPAALWDHVARFLQPHFDVYITDVRGRGLSEQGEHLDYRVGACVSDLQALIKTLGLESPVVMGHSMGARFGARLAAQTDVVGELIMLDPPASAPGARPYPIPMERTLKMTEAARRGEGEAYLRQPHIAKWPEAMLRQRAQWMATCDLRAITEAYRDFDEQDIYADVERVSCPVTLVVAQASGVILDDEVAEFQRHKPRLKVIRLEGAAHQLQAENTDQFFELLQQILIPRETT